jgi:hypothetical protein
MSWRSLFKKLPKLKVHQNPIVSSCGTLVITLTILETNYAQLTQWFFGLWLCMILSNLLGIRKWNWLEWDKDVYQCLIQGRFALSSCQSAFIQTLAMRGSSLTVSCLILWMSSSGHVSWIIQLFQLWGLMVASRLLFFCSTSFQLYLYYVWACIARTLQR